MRVDKTTGTPPKETRREVSNKTLGLYEKFIVTRTDGSSEPGGKHEGCRYFVLDISCDQHAAPALVAYAESCERDGYHALAADIRAIMSVQQAMHDQATDNARLLSALEASEASRKELEAVLAEAKFALVKWGEAVTPKDAEAGTFMPEIQLSKRAVTAIDAALTPESGA